MERIKDFQYSLPTRLVFGRQALSALADLVAEYNAGTVAIVSGQGSCRKSGLYDEVLAVLRDPIVELRNCPENPDTGFIDSCVEQLKSVDVGLVLAIGGGSVIDSAKAIALSVANNYENIWLYKNSRAAFPKPAIAVGVILTTLGTGSEVNGGFVLDNKAEKVKVGLANLSTRPRFSCCNPEHSYTLNSDTLRNNYIDILSHLLEQYFSFTDHVSVVDHMLLGTFSYFIEEDKQFLSIDKNYDTRSEMMLTSSLSMSYLFSLGKDVAWLLHFCAHQVAVEATMNHGESLAFVLPGWLRYLESSGRYDNKILILKQKLGLADKSLGAYFTEKLAVWGFFSRTCNLGSRQLKRVVDELECNQVLLSRADIERSDLECILSNVEC
ncbi:iron-containing alcohol dehydrogenase [Neptuniibacter sp. 2_MG-2023]|uniref:iron-containing alcohol dehydrogenase n=1 Tax=Neptuniibacter sp. 2_MG-2023 TaxID=3062671 RepID=UPI0026E453DF|nr:iron-containing alcohol dehydrogenase [Neptuniibacter sp. 2_MG-2023]MDO6514527.1 iron-containing alcohol dehydrogenase [Neptuniibacter sp. 2_MG-2023]